MARTPFSLAEDTWTDLGAGLSTLTVTLAPDAGKLHINTTNSDVASQQLAPSAIRGRQISNTVAADNFWVKATAPGWEIVIDK